MTTLAPPPTTHLWPRLRAAVAVALPSWLVARGLVGVALFVARIVTTRGVDDPLARTTAAHGLLAWDGAFYADIAQHGYATLPRAALRFFPLTPLAGRAVGELGVGARAGVVIVANVAALIAGAFLVVLVRREGLGDRTAARATWLLALAPSAFVLVMGYAEAFFLVAAIGAFVGLRERRWLLVVLLGLLAGLSRPSGFVLAVPIAIEAARGLRAARGPERWARAAAVLAPFAGCAVYLAWVDHRYGDALLPFRIQTRANLKGSFANPLTSIGDALDGLVHGRTIGTGLHVPWMVLVVALVVIAFRRLPSSYGGFAAATIASAVTSHNLDSFERYALAAFPILIVVALLAYTPRWERAVISASALAMTGYATLAFTHAYVP
jgi:hypothetical protein